MKHITGIKKGESHGYNQWIMYKKLWFRGNIKHNRYVGYVEQNMNDKFGIGDEGTIVEFHII